jgi:hypothetical protein
MIKTLYKVLFGLILFILPGQLVAQNLNNIEFFKQRDFGKYFISDMFSPNTEIRLGMGLLRSAYNINPDRNSTFAFYVESVMGTEIPLLYWNISGPDSGSKLSISIPLSTSIWLDFNEPITNPVVNTDYRVGSLQINYLHELNFGFVKNASLSFIPFFHESSHIGDEITIYRIQSDFPITRVNATRNTAEMSITINDENGKQDNNHSFKFGTSMLYNKTKGYYRMRAAEGDTSKIIPSDTRMEWYGQYQWHGPSGIIKDPKFTTVFSLELRNRLRYNYPYYIARPSSSTGPDEVNLTQKYVPSVNGYLGYRYRPNMEKTSYIGVYFRFYLGINPHGQFRNIPGHRFYGFSMVYEN